ncbi:MAG: protein translocase subunit SecD [Verrucomicrobiota bacterium]
MNSRIWKLLFIIFVVSWSLWEMTPPMPRDLLLQFEESAQNKDAAFEAIVQQAKSMQATNVGRAYGNLWDAVGTNDLAKYFPFVNLQNEPNPKRAILNRIQKDASGQIKFGLDLQGGTAFTMELDLTKLEDPTQKERVIGEAVVVLSKRVDKFGVAEPVIQPSGDNRIEVQMPGLAASDVDEVVKILSKPAFLEFRLVHPQSAQLIAQDIIEPGYVKLRQEDKQRDGTKVYREYLVRKKAERGLTGKYLKRAGVYVDPLSNKPKITFEFNNEGATLFGEITTTNVNNQLAIVLDGELYSAPNINEPITGGHGEISGDFDLREAFQLANVLENPLEAPLKLINQNTVDPTLGKDSVNKGLTASVAGVTAVAVFMIGYYLFAGGVAVFAMCLNLVILMGIMCYLDATLTLPGIAGILLTVGMAVDANVLIFERIREELAAGKSLRGALAAGYDKAFGTIFDANITTLIASVILIYLGTGPVKGFGVTLTIGVAASMFTALVVTRLIFDWLITNNRIQSLPMLQFGFLKDTKIDFLKFAKPAFALSWALVIIGTAWGFYRGQDALGVEFRGGDKLTYSFTQKVEVDQLRAELAKAGVEAQIQYQRSLGDASEMLQILAEFESGDEVTGALEKSFPGAGLELKSTDKVGPTVGQEIRETAVIAVLLSLLGILIYVAFRYEFSFAVGAVAAVVHDVFMTVGWFFLAGGQMSGVMIAAVLTIIGFSINDTIVIFDRVREDLKLGKRGSLKDILNLALNQTLSRTIITSGTVLLSTLSLYIFGGTVINDFSFTFLVGIISGTYSTIYIASAIVLWWHKGERPKIGSGPAPAVVTEPVAVTKGA